MIHIIQAGQSGKAKYLMDMHRVRTKIFRDRMKWDVNINEMELEIDEYDTPETIYILNIDKNDKVVGLWRFLLTTSPSMIRNIWPQYLKTLPIPYSASMCETSRFGVYAKGTKSFDPNVDRFGACALEDKRKEQKIVSQVTAEMIVALIETCIMCGITDMFTLYDVKIKRLLERIGFKPYLVSEIINLEGNPTVTARFKMDQDLLDAVLEKTKIALKITPSDLPPLLLEMIASNSNTMEIRRAV